MADFLLASPNIKKSNLSGGIPATILKDIVACNWFSDKFWETN